MKRWVTHRKAEVVAAVRGGLLSLEEACSRYSLSGSWQESIDRYGFGALRTSIVLDIGVERGEPRN